MSSLMNNKISFVIEFFLSGLYIAIYSLVYKFEKLPDYLSKEIADSFLYYGSRLIPLVVLLSIVGHLINIDKIDEYFRKHVFSLLIFIPMMITWGDLEFTYWFAAVHLFSTVLSLYDSEKPMDLDNMTSFSGVIDYFKKRPAFSIIFTFIFVISIGTILLFFSANADQTITFLDALFTATSATCVTGLSTLSITESFNRFGQVVILILIQIGGLGLMTIVYCYFMLIGRSLEAKDQVLMSGVLDETSFQDLLTMIINIVKYTFVIEFIGGILLSILFYNENLEIGASIYYGFFHSISAFCNAGFALFDNSLVEFKQNGWINTVVCCLILLGGLGFLVMNEILLMIKEKRKLVNLSIHSKVVLTTHLSLVVVGAVYIFFSEFLGALDSYDLGDKLLISIFQSITTRTAGFNTVNFSELNQHTIYLMTLLMFIGASSGSTGGGIKITTFAVLLQSIKSTLRGGGEVQFFDRRLPNELVVRATSIIIISLMIVSLFILIMLRLEPQFTFFEIFFEVVSAFATVGLSLGITASLSGMGKVAIILLMFIGRIGPLTVALAIGQKEYNSGKLEYPEGRLMIG